MLQVSPGWKVFFNCILKGCRFYITKGKGNRARSPRRTRYDSNVMAGSTFDRNMWKARENGPFPRALSSVSHNNRTSTLMCKKDHDGLLCDSLILLSTY